MPGPKEKPPDGAGELDVTGLTQDVELPFDELDEEAVNELLGPDEDESPEDAP